MKYSQKVSGDPPKDLFIYFVYYIIYIAHRFKFITIIQSCTSIQRRTPHFCLAEKGWPGWVLPEVAGYAEMVDPSQAVARPGINLAQPSVTSLITTNVLRLGQRHHP